MFSSPAAVHVTDIAFNNDSSLPVRIKAMAREIGSRVLGKWGSLKATFQFADTDKVCEADDFRFHDSIILFSPKDGYLSPAEFKRALLRFNMTLTAEEFFALFKHFDKSMNGKISYEDFVRGI